MFEFLIVRLSQKDNYKNTFDLRFKLENNSFVLKWIDRLLAAQQRQDPISEPWAFYNLNSEWNSDRIIEFINYHIDKCNELVPGMFDKKLSRTDDQDTLNYLHSVFELHHGQIDSWKTNELFKKHPNQLRESLSHINQTIHRAEQKFNGSGYLRIVYFDLPKKFTFSNEDYKLFTNVVEFGSAYSMYCDVGKNLESLSQDEDIYHHDFVPNIHYSADFWILFFDRNNDEAEKKKLSYQNFYEKNKEYFESQGYYKDDPRLTTGFIKLAQLIYTDKQKLLEQISKYNNIQSVFLI